jgi:cytochrome c oxidase subunit IV
MSIDIYSLTLLLVIAALSYLLGYLSVQGAMAEAKGNSAQRITRKKDG